MKGKHVSKINSSKLILITFLSLILVAGISMAILANRSMAKATETNETATITFQKVNEGYLTDPEGKEITSLVENVGLNYTIAGNCFVIFSSDYKYINTVWATPETTTSFTKDCWAISTGKTSGIIEGDMTVTANFVENPDPYPNWGYIAGRIIEEDGSPIVGATVTFLPDPRSNMTDYYGITDEFGIYYFRVPLNVPGDSIIFAKEHDTLVNKFEKGIKLQINLVNDITLSRIDSIKLTASSNDEGHDQFRYYYYVNDKLCWTVYKATISDEAKNNCYVNIDGDNLVVTWDKIGNSDNAPIGTVREKGVVVPIPKEGYEFTGWTVNGHEIVPGMITEAMDFEAHYQAIAAPSNPTNSAQTGDSLGMAIIAIIAILGVAGGCFVVSRVASKKK